MPSTLLPPKILPACDQEKAKRVCRFYVAAYQYALAAKLFLDRIEQYIESVRAQLWNQARPVTAAEWFGPYSPKTFDTVSFIIRGVVNRFERGYEGSGAVQFLCVRTSQERCDQSVLANAREFGIIRLCPRLIAKNPATGGIVILHEFLHQGLGVGDVRHKVCRRRNETRCYRSGAKKLINSGNFTEALHNNDNYAYFAKAAHAAFQAQHNEEASHDRIHW
jgi:hypothetical protein